MKMQPADADRYLRSSNVMKGPVESDRHPGFVDDVDSC